MSFAVRLTDDAANDIEELRSARSSETPRGAPQHCVRCQRIVIVVRSGPGTVRLGEEDAEQYVAARSDSK